MSSTYVRPVASRSGRPERRSAAAAAPTAMLAARAAMLRATVTSQPWRNFCR